MSLLEGLQLGLSAAGALAVPAMLGLTRWLMRVELRLARLEWQGNTRPQENNS